MNAPTFRQLEVLGAIRGFWALHGYAPGVRDIGRLLGIGSTNGTNDHLKALVRKGLIERDSHRARSIRLTRAGRLAIGIREAS
jgi:repressor LexA